MLHRQTKFDTVILTKVTFDDLAGSQPAILTQGARWKEKRGLTWWLRSVIPDPDGRRDLIAIHSEKIQLKDGQLPGQSPHHSMQRHQAARRMGSGQ